MYHQLRPLAAARLSDENHGLSGVTVDNIAEVTGVTTANLPFVSQVGRTGRRASNGKEFKPTTNGEPDRS